MVEMLTKMNGFPMFQNQISPTSQSQAPQGRLLQGRLHGQLPGGPGAAQKDLHRAAAAAGNGGGHGVVPELGHWGVLPGMG